MELTAIKIPGKNTRDQRRRKHTFAHGAVSKTQPKRGRPMRSSKSLSLSSSRASTPITQKPPKKPRTLRNIKSRHKLQPIEKLPTEIITRIFLFNPTPCLALVSPILAARLSNEYVYNKTLLQTFGPCWELQFREWEDKGSRESELEIDDSKRDLPPEPSSYAQSSILRCRWATLARLRHAESTFLLQKQKELMQFLVLPTRYESLSDDFFTMDWERFVDEVPEIGYEEWMVEEGRTKPLLRFHDEVVEIPISLLCAPWTEAKVQYLWYLWRAGAKIEKCSSTAGEEATTGLEAAILSCNIHAIHLLTQLSISIPITTPLILQFLRNLLKLSLSHESENNSFPSAQKTISSSPPSPNQSTSLISREQMKTKDLSQVLDAFISYFAGRESKNRNTNKRRAEVEREILELRRGLKRGGSTDSSPSISPEVEEEKARRKEEGEWMVGVLGEIYGLDVGS